MENKTTPCKVCSKINVNLRCSDSECILSSYCTRCLGFPDAYDSKKMFCTDCYWKGRDKFQSYRKREGFRIIIECKVFEEVNCGYSSNSEDDEPRVSVKELDFPLLSDFKNKHISPSGKVDLQTAPMKVYGLGSSRRGELRFLESRTTYSIKRAKIINRVSTINLGE